MRYMMLYKPGKETDALPTEREMAAMGELIGDMARSGVLIATDGLQPSSKGMRVRIDKGGGFAITDGPFTESKELIAGFAIVQVKTKEEAIELAKRFLKAVGEGESEIRLMHDAAAFPPS
ncbi:MAG: YciI family protein [Acidobacteriota bacterium]|nr:YciI family protein [Acidobacteriota bacterium]